MTKTKFAGIVIGLTGAALVLVTVCGSPVLGSTIAEIDDQAQRTSQDKIVRVITSYVEQTRPDDSFVEVRDGIWAKSSNYNGVEIDGVTYYYRLRPHQSFDPLSRGVVEKEDVTVKTVIDDTPDFIIVIYTLDEATNPNDREV